jgi:hypothetical protein
MVHAVPLGWRLFIAVQLIGFAAMVVGVLFPSISETAVVVITWFVLLLPGDIVGPVVPRFLLDSPHSMVMTAWVLVILLVNAAFWFCLMWLVRFISRTIKGLTKRSSQPLTASKFTHDSFNIEIRSEARPRQRWLSFVSLDL